MSRYTRSRNSRGRTLLLGKEFLTPAHLRLPSAYTSKLIVAKERKRQAPLARVVKVHKGFTVFTREHSPLKPKY